MKSLISVFLLSLLIVQNSQARLAIGTVRTAYTSTNVTASAWVKISDGFSIQIEGAQIFDSSGQSLRIAYGESGSEIEIPVTIIPGGNGDVSFTIPRDQKISLKAYSGSATSGYSLINFYE